MSYDDLVEAHDRGMEAARIARELYPVYGDRPAAVGAADGTEDDFGDLLCDVLTRAGVYDAVTEDQARWDAVQDAAGEAGPGEAMEQFVLRLLNTAV